MVNIQTKLSGFYKLEAVKIKSGKRRLLADWFPNLITDGGLERIAGHSDWLTYCTVGTGSTTPAFGDSGLASFVGYNHGGVISTTNGVTGSSPYYRWMKKIYRFNPGDATGNIAEVGIGWANTNGSLFSRALILDSGGSPTTITILSDEYLDVTYECRKYLPETDADTYQIDLRSITHDVTGGRAAEITNTVIWEMPFNAFNAANTDCRVYDGTIGDIAGYPSGTTYVYTSTYSIASYVSGSHEIEWTYSFSLTQGNLTNYISAIMVYMCGGAYQFGVSPDIEKTSDDIMSLTFKASWGRK